MWSTESPSPASPPPTAAPPYAFLILTAREGHSILPAALAKHLKVSWILFASTLGSKLPASPSSQVPPLLSGPVPLSLHLFQDLLPELLPPGLACVISSAF